MKGKLIILSGPSGVGKDTVLNAWIKFNSKVKRVVTYTTRTKRPLEIDGIDYCFVSIEKFKELIDKDAFIEYKEVYGNYYGSPVADTNAFLEQELIPVLKIDVAGALDAMKKRPEAATIFLLPPSHEELERRIRNRATEQSAELIQRINTSKWELSCANRYKYQIVNTDIKEVIIELEKTIKDVKEGL